MLLLTKYLGREKLAEFDQTEDSEEVKEVRKTDTARHAQKTENRVENSYWSDKAEWSTLISPDPSRHCTLIG